ncbi:MAG: hypothetical protein AB8F74_06080, partial [Saprospiraceae bacterium]
IDNWNYDSEDLIPIDILEKTLLIEHQGDYSSRSFVKAASYLKRHPLESVNLVHDKIRLTEKYVNEEYYRGWIDEEV